MISFFFLWMLFVYTYLHLNDYRNFICFSGFTTYATDTTYLTLTRFFYFICSSIILRNACELFV